MPANTRRRQVIAAALSSTIVNEDWSYVMSDRSEVQPLALNPFDAVEILGVADMLEAGCEMQLTQKQRSQVVAISQALAPGASIFDLVRRLEERDDLVEVGKAARKAFLQEGVYGRYFEAAVASASVGHNPREVIVIDPKRDTDKMRELFRLAGVEPSSAQ